MRPLRCTAFAATVVLAMLTAACGTRLSDDEFRRMAGGEQASDARVGESGGPAGALRPDDGLLGDPGSVPSPSPTSPDPGSGGGATGDGDGDGDGGQPGGAAATGGGGDPGRSEPAAPNTASDVGVTATEITVGIIASRSGPLGPNVFMPVYYGANAFFELLNAGGGVNGRTVRLVHCDDAEDPGRNQQCVRRLVDDEKVFALVGNATRAYSGAEYVAAEGVPDIGGQPIGTEYWRYPTFFTIRGSEFPRDGTVGYQGRVYHQTLQFRFLKERLGLRRAGVVHYNVPQSQTYADYLVRSLRIEGVAAVAYEVNVAFPNFDAVVADMRATGVDSIWDVMDATGNQNLCQAMERGAFGVKAKVGTTNGWSRDVRRRMPEICRRSLLAVSESRPNADTSHEAVARFRRTMTQLYGEEHDASLHQWELEGWAAAKLFTDAVAAQGADLTRAGVVEWLNAQRDYTAGGLLTPVEWRGYDFSSRTSGRECLVVARWDDDVANFVAITPVPYCQDEVPYVAYTPS